VRSKTILAALLVVLAPAVSSGQSAPKTSAPKTSAAPTDQPREQSLLFARESRHVGVGK